MGRFREAIRGNEVKLADELYVDDLWIHLKTHNILTDRQLARCKAKVSHINTLETAVAFYVFIATV